MRRDIEHIVHVLGLAQVGNEANRLRVGNGVGKRLGKRGIARKLQNPHLLVLVGREIGTVVVERFARGCDHAVHVVAVLGIEVDLDRQPVPVTLAHLPARRQVGEEGQHRAVHLVVEIAPAVFFPCLLQIARRQRDLVGAGRNGSLKVDPVGLAIELVVGARSFIFELGHALRLTQAALAPLVAVHQLVAGVAQCGEQLHVVEEAAVQVQVVGLAVVGEALVFHRHAEIHVDRCAWLQRLCQLENAKAQHRVVQRHLVRWQAAQHGHCARRHVHVERIHSTAVLVDQTVVAIDHQAALSRKDIHIGTDFGHAWLCQILVLPVLLLETDLSVHLLVAGNVLVEDVGVVEDPATGGDEAAQADSKGAASQTPQALACQARAHAPFLRQTAHPEAVRQQQQAQDKQTPVQQVPVPSREEVAETVHVRVLHLGQAGNVVQVVVEVQHAKHHLPRQQQNHRQVADELVVAQNLQRERQQAHEYKEGATLQGTLQVEQGLQRCAALDQLKAHRCQHAAGHEAGDHAQQGQALGKQRHPVGYRQRVRHVRDLELALLEDQLTGVEGHDQYQHEAEAARKRFEHHAGHGIDLGAVHLAAHAGAADKVGNAYQQHHQKRNAPEDADGIKAQYLPALTPGRAAADIRLVWPVASCCRRCGQRGGEGSLAAPAPLAAVGPLRLEQHQRQNQKRQRHRAPESPVGEDEAGERGQGAIGLGRGKVARHAAKGAQAEGVHQHHQPLVADVAREHAGHAPQHEENNHSHVDQQHGTRGRCQQHQEGADQQQIRNDKDRKAPQVRGDGKWTDARHIHPGHHGAKHDAQRHQHKDGQAGHQTRGKASEQVVALLHGRGKDHVGDTQLGVAQYRAGHENGDDEHRNHREHAKELDDHHGRVAVHIANGAAHHHCIAAGGTKGHQREDETAQPQEGLAQLVAQVKPEELKPHAQFLRLAPLRRAGWRESSESTRPPDPVRPAQSHRRAGSRSAH